MGFFTRELKNGSTEVRVGRIVGVSIAGIIGLITLFSSFTKLNPGYTGVRVILGAVQESTFEPGFHLMTPYIETVVKMDNKVRKTEVKAASTSKDLQAVSSTLAINYHLSKEKSVDMFKSVGLTYEDTLLQPAIQEATKSIMAQYKAEELIKNRAEVSVAIMDEISRKMNGYGIMIDEFNITDFDFSQAFNDAIEQKLVAEQNKIKAATENEQRVAAAEADAAEAKARAEGEAEAARVKAEGEAAAIRAKAAAEAEANEQIRKSITNELIDYNRIEKWNGELPNIMTGSDGNVIVNATK